MALRHVVMFRFAPGVTMEQRARLAQELRQLPAAIPEIGAYTVGTDAGLVEGNWDFAVVGDFASTEDWQVYRDHPVHQAVIAEHVRPLVTERAATQIVIP
jgi:Stress responsive A/B Barrel Domain